MRAPSSRPRRSGLATIAALACAAAAAALAGGVEAVAWLRRDAIVQPREARLVATRCQATQAFESRRADPEGRPAAVRLICPAGRGPEAFADALRAAVVASEDRRFLHHDGVDEAAFRRLVALSSGGSTLSQQIARTLFFDARAYPLLERKLHEWAQARAIERALTKAEILEVYLNVAPFGRGLFGFEDAARHWLDAPASRLAPHEAALLVGLLPSPATRDPYVDPEAALRATSAVLDAMEREGYLDPAAAAAEREAARALLAPARWAERPRGRGSAPVEHRRALAFARAALDAAGREPAPGARILLTIDPALQASLDRALAARALPGYAPAAALLGPDGSVLALAGPRFADMSWSAAWLGLRSMGSLGKIPVHAAALEREGLAEALHSDRPLPGYAAREPNGACAGPLALPEMLARSCNRHYVRLATQLGARPAEIARGFGFAPPEADALLPVGGMHGNALAAASMMQAIAAGGLRTQPHVVLGVVDPRGRLETLAPAERRRVLPRATAEALARALRGPVRPGGTAYESVGRDPPALVHGKTGTSDGGRDAVFAGFTRDFAGAVAYHAVGEPPRRASGAGEPARVFRSVMDDYWPARNRLEAAGAPADTLASLAQPATARARNALTANLHLLAALALGAAALGFARAARRAGRPAWAGAGAGEAAPA